MSIDSSFKTFVEGDVEESGATPTDTGGYYFDVTSNTISNSIREIKSSITSGEFARLALASAGGAIALIVWQRVR